MSHDSIHQFVSRSNQSLYQILLEWARSEPNRPYFYSQKGAITYAQVDAISVRIARYLRSFDKNSEKSIIAVNISNADHLFYLIWAGLASGICLAFLPPARDPSQVQLLMKQVGASVLVTDIPELLKDSLQIPFESIVDTASVHNEAPDPISLVKKGLEPSTPAFIFQTSGTTGEAKWVMVCHGQFIAAIDCLRNVGGLEHAVNQVVYISPLLSHSYGLSSLLEYTSMGSAIILPRGSSPLGPFDALQDPILSNLVTAIEGVPYFYSLLSRVIGRMQLPVLRHVGLGGGKVDLTGWDRIRSFYPSLSYSVRYGMTETPSVISNKQFVHPYADDWKSSGKVLPLYDLRIVDETGKCLDTNQIGEIQIKGDCLAVPYYGENGETDGYFATGDIGYISDNEELFIIGRKSLYLKNRGFRISPESVESVIDTFEKVKECRVSMRDSRLWAEVVQSNDSFSTQELLTFLKGKLPVYAMPDIVTPVASIPRTPSGKIKRH